MEGKKRIDAQRGKPQTPTPEIDALIGDEEQTRWKEKKGRGTEGETPHPNPGN